MKKKPQKFSLEKALLGSQANYLEALKRDREEIFYSIITAKTPSALIKQRKGKGEKMFRYVTGGAFTRALNLAFGMNWNFEVKESVRDGSQLTVLGKLTVNYNNMVITKEQFGSAEVYKGVPLGDIYKKATTDALKKCASMLGLFGDIYGQVDDQLEDVEKPKYNHNTLEEAVEKLETQIVEGAIDRDEALSRIENGLIVVRQSGFNDLLDRLILIKNEL